MNTKVSQSTLEKAMDSAVEHLDTLNDIHASNVNYTSPKKICRVELDNDGYYKVITFDSQAIHYDKAKVTSVLSEAQLLEYGKLVIENRDVPRAAF